MGKHADNGSKIVEVSAYFEVVPTAGATNSEPERSLVAAIAKQGSSIVKHAPRGGRLLTRI
jgi:hypothetical protein